MIEVTRVVHFSIPVADLQRSIDFYSQVVGLKLIRANDKHAFMDAGGTCVLLCREAKPINNPQGLDIVHHSFAVSPEHYASLPAHLASCGVDVLYSEDLSDGTVNGPRTYFRDPDGTRLEIINLKSYNPNPLDTSGPTERNRQPGK